LVGGSVLIYIFTGAMKVRPRLVGKCATVFQMLTLGWLLLKIEQPPHGWFMVAAGLFTFASGAWYIYDGIRLLNASETAKPQ
jgi:phosphatidylglycerophosphate synthase